MGTPPIENRENAFSTALRWLTARDYTEKELLGKLTKKGHDSKTAQETLDKCRHLSYVDDRRFARIAFEFFHRKGYGSRYIRSAMMKKGFPIQIVNETFDELHDAGRELENARKVLKKKRPRFEGMTDRRKKKEKIYRFLNYRGFSPTIISELIRQEESPD